MLRAAGETEVHLLLIDEQLFSSKLKFTWFAKPRSPVRRVGRRVQTLIYALTLLPAQYRRLYIRQRSAAFAAWVKREIRRQTKPQISRKRTQFTFEMTDAVKTVAKAHRQAAYAYEPEPYDGPLTFLRAGDDIVNIPQFRVLRYVARGGLQIEDVPGTHDTMLDDAYVGVVAARVQRWLDDMNR